MTQHPLVLGWQLRSYLALRPLLQPLMRRVVAKRVAKGKDDPVRSPEKLGQSSVSRPEGTLIWLHAVGLGEVLALRPLLKEMTRQAPNVSFLVTSTARSSGQVMGANLPANTIHQFLPLDGPRFVAAFLDHWQPDLSIWSEQDLWPGAICDTARRGIPLAYINARITEAGHKSRARFRPAFGDLMRLFDLVAGQDADSVARLRDLGAQAPRQMGSLKPAAEPLLVDAAALNAVKAQTEGRKIWVAASTHKEDEALVIAAHQELLRAEPSALLILAPRVPDRRAEIGEALADAGLSYTLRSTGATPSAADPVYMADTFGELGLWYRLAGLAFVGGSAGDVGGHNPWEAIGQGCAVLHGANTSNFRQDYADLAQVGLATECAGADAAVQIADVLANLDKTGDAAQVRQKAEALVVRAREGLTPLARDLLALLRAAP
ncbi:3-deoxy-D-manno-octulosonic acid transferase [Shimia sp. R9_2]|uniref:3-deoxy-D-manno-octulosonic acid transferase n=1 Tax=Shimia sp. R9_2 TaxID=2821112 RepID=UPI001ADC3403|nr:glycosyltransferase N-terminal domain-containing protein [Shimia sp. R9_2]MBO9398356.1 3-deoxy-D-manno-octulosonic acid transferase [Shimia sp. R9_2]